MTDSDVYESHQLGWRYHSSYEENRSSLYAGREQYRTWSIIDCERFFLPPLRLGQYQLYFKQDRVVGLVTWAWIDETCKAKLIHEDLDLIPDDWAAGDALYFAEFVAPFGHTKMIMDDVGNNVFPRERAFSVRRRPDNSVYKVCHWIGSEERAKERPEFAIKSASRTLGRPPCSAQPAACAMSVFEKSSPLKRSGSPRLLARA